MGPRSQLSWRSLAIRAGQRPNGIIARVGPSGQTRKKAFSQRPPEAPNNPICSPPPAWETPCTGRGDCPLVLGGNRRGAEAIGPWDRNRSSSSENICPIPGPGPQPCPAPPRPVGCKAPPQPRRVPEKLPRPAAPSPPPARGFFQHQGVDSSRAGAEERRPGGRGPGRRGEGRGAQERKGEERWGRGGEGRADAGWRAGRGARRPSPGAVPTGAGRC